MNATRGRKRWPMALAVIAVVVIVAAVLIYSYRDAPGRIPAAAVSSGPGDVIVTWRDVGGAHAQQLNSSGQPLWGEDGVLISGSSDTRYKWVSDGAGGAIFAWYEGRDDPSSFQPVTLFAQRVNDRGELLWGDGVVIGEGVDYPVVLPDGTGGAVFAWNEYRPFHRALHEDLLRVKKFDAAGASLWGDEGVLVAASTPYHELTEEEIAAGIKGTYTREWPTYSGRFAVVADGSGGAIVTWEDELTAMTEIVYAQRFDVRGEAAWPEKLTVANGGLLIAESDGAGGAVVRTQGTSYSGIGMVGESLLVHISDGGEILSSRRYDLDRILISDGTGGFFTLRFERDPPTGPPTEGRSIYYVQREDADGRDLWPEIRVIDPGENERVTELEYVADGSGGIIIAWRLTKNSAPFGGITAQRIDAGGALLWGEKGLPVFGGSRIRFEGIVSLLGDGSGGATVIAALGTGALYGDMVYAQKLDAEGNRLWGDGVRIN